MWLPNRDSPSAATAKCGLAGKFHACCRITVACPLSWAPPLVLGSGQDSAASDAWRPICRGAPYALDCAGVARIQSLSSMHPSTITYCYDRLVVSGILREQMSRFALQHSSTMAEVYAEM